MSHSFVNLWGTILIEKNERVYVVSYQELAFNSSGCNYKILNDV